MAGKCGSCQERADKSRQARNMDKAETQPQNDDPVDEDGEPSLSFVAKIIESFWNETYIHEYFTVTIGLIHFSTHGS